MPPPANGFAVKGPMVMSQAAWLCEKGRSMIAACLVAEPPLPPDAGEAAFPEHRHATSSHRSEPPLVGIVCDLGEVDTSDASALAVIFAWQREALRHRGVLQLHNAHPNLRLLADLYNVEDFLN